MNGLRRIQKDNRAIKILFIISITAMSGMLAIRGSWSGMAINMFCAFLVGIFLVFRIQILKDIFSERKYWIGIITFLFTWIALTYFVTDFCYWVGNKKIAIGFGIISAFGMFGLFYLFLSKGQKLFFEFFKSLEKVEALYLLIFGILMVGIVIITFNQTNVFYGPAVGMNDVIQFDVVYTSDTGGLMDLNVYMNINASENDIRQPLFGLYAMPFAILATLLSKIFYFVPHNYPIFMNGIQIILLEIGIVLLSRMLHLTSVKKLIFLLLLSTSYPFLLYSLNMEQYIFAVFWLIVFLYCYEFKIPNKDYYFIGAVGSMVTTGILFPLLSYSRNIKIWAKDILSALGKAIVLVILSGQIPLLLQGYESLKRLGGFTGEGLAFSDKLLQYLNFIASCFVAPIAGMNDTTYPYISYQMMEIHTINIVGIGLLTAAIIGFLLNYKERFAKICMVWIGFSFVLLCIMGWGTSENGLILYALYFFWAFFSLIYMGIHKIFVKTPVILYGIGAIAIGILLFYNIPGIWKLIQFGITYYFV